MATLSMHADVPPHVSQDRVFDYDLFHDRRLEKDVRLGMMSLFDDAPDIFWTPRNGGHWVATRADDIEVIETDYARFSTHSVQVPKKPDALPRELPLELDPPRHTAFRKPLTLALLPGNIARMEAGIRDLTVSLIEGFKDRGGCEFVAEFGKVFPICVFLDLVDLPREDRHYLVPLADQSVRGRNPDVRLDAQLKVNAYLRDVVRERRETPGTDLLSALVNVEEDGRKITEAEAISYATLVMFGGLDTVAGMLSFIIRFLARNPDHRRDMAENFRDETFMRNAIEELLRRHGMASDSRMITHDFDYQGVSFRAGEMILAPNMLVDLDDRRVADPELVDFRRSPRIQPGIFGKGAHMCPGAVLARRELRIFLEEWFSRIPDFGLAPGTAPTTETGIVSTITELRIAWPA